MILANHIGTEGWNGVPDLYYSKSVSITQNQPTIDSNVEVNVLCLFESEKIIPTFSNDILERFDLILTWRKDILEHFNNSRKFLYGTKWVDELDSVSNKENKISFLCSKKLMVPGHRYRHEVLGHCMKNSYLYPLNIDYFITPPHIESKNSVLNQYKFAIVMENHVKENYFTEKIIDCFATKTIPIYWGCPNIGEYFNKSGILQFNSYEEFDSILMNCSGELYNNKMPAVKENLKIAKKYYSLWDRIDNEIKDFLVSK